MVPILYSFRRCPYAMRARLALHVSGLVHELREVKLNDKPAAMLSASPKGSVPVLVLPDGSVIDESWDIMIWALQQNDPLDWLGRDGRLLKKAAVLVEINDSSFKAALDRYKYAEAHPEHPKSHYRREGETWLAQLEARLVKDNYLLGNTSSIADAALVPFIRQFAGVDPDWFACSPYAHLRTWMETIIQTHAFSAIMQKLPAWHSGDPPHLVTN